VKRRWPYARWFHVREWGWYISRDEAGPVVQVNLGRLGVSLPIRYGRNRGPS
jgi:hypothetical protein